MLKMETVGAYQPLAGTRRNTMRASSPKYITTRPGDLVEMAYTDEHGNSLGHEKLRVRSIAFGDFETIVSHHWRLNHAVPADAEQMREILRGCYDETATHARAPFCVVYFD